MTPENSFIRVGGEDWPAHVLGLFKDGRWDGRESRAVTLTMGITEAMTLLPNGARWSIVTRGENGKEFVEDCADFCVSGPATDNRDGTVTIHMGRRTAGDALAELEEAYDA